MKHLSNSKKSQGYIKKTSENPRENSVRSDMYSDNFNDHGKYVDISSGARKKKKKMTPKKIISLIFFSILGIIGAIMLFAYYTLHSFKYEDLQEEPVMVDEYGLDLINDSQVLNVMLIGSDSMSVGDHGRSDSLMIISLDLKNKKIKLTSLMRDIWVNIPGHGKDRFNAAYAYGGPKLTIETIEKSFGIRIDRYAVVDFDGFAKIIDALGGIDIELTADESAYINKYSGDKHTLKGSGIKHLTGLQALHYSRDRNSIGSDYDRTSRQRVVIHTIIEKLKKANISQITEFISTIGPMVTTNFKTEEISRLAAGSLEYLNYPFSEFRLPTDDNVRNETISQKMVLVINDMAKARKDLLNFIYENEEMAEQEATKVTEKTKKATTKASTNSQATKTAKSTTEKSKATASSTKAKNTTKSTKASPSTSLTSPSKSSSTSSNSASNVSANSSLSTSSESTAEKSTSSNTNNSSAK